MHALKGLSKAKESFTACQVVRLCFLETLLLRLRSSNDMEHLHWTDKNDLIQFISVF